MPKAQFFGRTALTFVVVAVFVYGLAVVKESHAARDLAAYTGYWTALFAFLWLVSSIWEARHS